MTIKCSPYEVLYGQPPPMHLPYLPGESKVKEVDRSLNKREGMLQLVKFHLQRAQNRMKQIADKKRSERQFSIGDFVYLKLQPYRQQSVVQRQVHKLSPRYFGPYQIVDRIGAVAYQLDLPNDSAIHNVVHVSLLKKCVTPDAAPFVPVPPNGIKKINKIPEAILERKMVKRGDKAATKVFVKWQDTPIEKATWVFYSDFVEQFPEFHP